MNVRLSPGNETEENVTILSSFPPFRVYFTVLTYAIPRLHFHTNREVYRTSTLNSFSPSVLLTEY